MASLRWTARFILTLLLLASLGTALWNVWALVHDPAVGWMVERSEEDIVARLDAALRVRATPEKIDAHLQGLLAAEPREWARIEAVLDMAESRGLVLAPETTAALDAARGQDYTVSKLATGCAACMWDLEACTWSTVFYCRVPLELTPGGDVASIARESIHYARGEDVDEIDLLLSTMGVGAVVMVPIINVGSVPLKTGVALTKTAYRMGGLSKKVVAAGVEAARRSIDWDLLARSKPGRLLDDLQRAVRKDALQPVADFLRQVDSMREAVGARWALFMMRKLDDPKDAAKMAALAKAGGKKAPGALEMLGAKRFLRLAVRWSDEAWALVKATASVFLAAAMLLLGFGKSLALRGLRRLAREPGPERGRWWWRWLTRGRAAGI